MNFLSHYPFNKLRVPNGEVPTWHANNPTFHRGSDYGIVLTAQALYLYSPFWLSFSRWRRIALSSIESIQFKNSRFVPRLVVKTKMGTKVLRTPFDYKDEMEYDRMNLVRAAEQVSTQLAVASDDA
jgi:hypothetical protein